MATWILREFDLHSLIQAGSFTERFVTARAESELAWARANPERLEQVDLRAPRGSMSVKSFSFPPRELMARYPEESGAVATAAPSRLLVGARACELRALVYLDRVFGHEPTADPFYQEHREAQVIVSVDCIEPHTTCFCNLVDGHPYATDGFDLNLTPITGGYLLESGTQAGEALLNKIMDRLRPATPEALAERDQVRRATEQRLREINADFQPARSPTKALVQAEDQPVWDEQARGCVECGACTQICPTCHCFYLYDQGRLEQGFERLRAWDSCMWSGYSRMAGAPSGKPNPRARFRSRFANRFLHKYAWSPRQWDMLGCVGCGRCIEACPGRIDIRRVVKEVSA